MRAVVQRVANARVEVSGECVAEIARGLLVYLGIGSTDSSADLAYMVKRVSGLRVFDDENRQMNRDVTEAGGAVLVVSQFTLYGDARRGRRPSFSDAMVPAGAKRMVDDFVEQMRLNGHSCAQGCFGARMRVSSENDGPVTILLDSTRQF